MFSSLHRDLCVVLCLSLCMAQRGDRGKMSPAQALVQRASLKSACVELAASVSGTLPSIEAQSSQQPLQTCLRISGTLSLHTNTETHKSNRIRICLKQISVHEKRQQVKDHSDRLVLRPRCESPVSAFCTALRRALRGREKRRDNSWRESFLQLLLSCFYSFI